MPIALGEGGGRDKGPEPLFEVSKGKVPSDPLFKNGQGQRLELAVEHQRRRLQLQSARPPVGSSLGRPGAIGDRSVRVAEALGQWFLPDIVGRPAVAGPVRSVRGPPRRTGWSVPLASTQPSSAASYLRLRNPWPRVQKAMGGLLQGEEAVYRKALVVAADEYHREL
jgi:hypothetical protein